MSTARNALSGEVFPTDSEALEREVSALIERHGRKAVLAEVTAQTNRKRGPKSKPDLLAMHSVIKDDAWDLMQGRDPFRLRTNYKLAREFAKSIPGHSIKATIERLEKKLRAQRRKAAYWEAYMLTFATEVPHEVELRIYAELDKFGGRESTKLSHLSEKIIALYRERVGDPPSEWSIKKILSELPSAVPRTGTYGASLLAAVREK